MYFNYYFLFYFIFNYYLLVFVLLLFDSCLYVEVVAFLYASISPSMIAGLLLVHV